MEKKDYYILILSAILISSIISSSLLYVIPCCAPRPDLAVYLRYGTGFGPADLDPMDAWDSASFEIQDQVCEGLFGYNYSDPEMDIIPKLAKDYGIWQGSNYTVKLREDVWFHDGTKFDASAAKWNFDRLSYFMNNSLAKAGALFRYYDVGTQNFRYIINHTEIIDDHTLKFALNTQYGPFEALLCFNGAYMLSPTSTPKTEVIDTASGDLVGTGPFVYDDYKVGVEVKFHAWDYYWGPRAKIDKLIFSIIPGTQIRNDALLTRDIDILISPMSLMLEAFNLNPALELINVVQSTRIGYLGMNNKFINSTFRKAISYALNYSFILNQILDGHATRLRSPIPKGIRYANWIYNVADFNISKAREIMQGMGFGVGWNTTYPGSDELLWESTTFISFNYSSLIGSYIRERVNILLVENLRKIGIEVDEPGWCYFEPWICDPNYWEHLSNPDYYEIYFLEWIADYNDPSNYIYSLFTNRTISSNACRYNGYLAAKEADRNPLNLWDNVQLLMEAGLIEVNKNLRKDYYYRIQQLLVEEDMPWAFCYVETNYDAWNKDLKGFPSNPMDKVYFYPCYWDNTAFYAQ